jgi:hypothetical protein
MADNSGFPYCTKWKNYRYPLTRLEYSVGHKVVDDGYFDTKPLDIWISDDYFLMDLETEYVVTMTAATNDTCKSLKRPSVFIDGSSGQTETTAGNANPLLKLSTSDTLTNFDVVSSLANTISSVGKKQTLYTIAPGLHFGFTNTDISPFALSDRSGWVMSADALNGLPKIMDGTYTCWYKLPTDAGDTVVTEIIPNGIANKSMNIMWNANRHVPKRSTTAANNGQSITIQGSIDKTNWVDVVKLIDDMDMIDTVTLDVQNFMQQAQWDSNALDGDDYPYKRLKFEFEASASEVDLHPHQFIQVNITPN